MIYPYLIGLHYSGVYIWDIPTLLGLFIRGFTWDVPILILLKSFFGALGSGGAQLPSLNNYLYYFGGSFKGFYKGAIRDL